MVVFAILGVVLLATGGFVAGELAFENEVTDEVDAVLAEDEYEELRLVTVRTEFTDAGLVGDDRRVSIVLHRPVDHQYPDLPGEVAGRIAERTGADVVVEIEYTETDRHPRTPASYGVPRKRAWLQKSCMIRENSRTLSVSNVFGRRNNTSMRGKGFEPLDPFGSGS